MIVKAVKVQVRTSSMWPTDSSGGSGFGGVTVAIEDRWKYSYRGTHNESGLEDLSETGDWLLMCPGCSP